MADSTGRPAIGMGIMLWGVETGCVERASWVRSMLEAGMDREVAEDEEVPGVEKPLDLRC